MLNKYLFIFGLLLSLILGAISNADQYHFINGHIGERASGLGGAYSAVSDDPSGAYYNPAGMAFASNSYLSISTNSFKNSSSTYYNVLNDSSDKNWNRLSSSFFPSYFGILQDYEDIKLGFSIITPESDVLKQDDTVNLQDTNRRFVRNYNENSFVYLMGPSIAMEVDPSLSVGASLFLSQKNRDIIDNQWIFNNTLSQWEWLNFYSKESSTGLDAIVGLQYMPSKKLSLAFVVEDAWDFVAEADQQTITANHLSSYEVNGSYDLLEFGYKSRPLKCTIGCAYFLSPTIMWTFDLKYYPEHDAKNDQFDRKAVINYATGIEYYYTTNIPIRAGLYTNFSSVKEMYAGAYDIDLYGITCSIGWETDSSSLSTGLDYSWGQGKIGFNDSSGNLGLFDADMSNLYLFFSGSYKM